MKRPIDQAMLARAEEAAERGRDFARRGLPDLARASMLESVDLMEQAGVDVAAWVQADRAAVRQAVMS